MRVRYLYSSRLTGHIENLKKQRQKYPDVLLKVVDTSDIILEVLDARFFKEMRNGEIEKMITKMGKKIIYVLNKSDLVSQEKIPKKDLEEITGGDKGVLKIVSKWAKDRLPEIEQKRENKWNTYTILIINK